jgi:FkbM family methyltransferase
VVDVGANIGLFSIYCAKRVGSNGTIIAIEPEPRNYASLFFNKRINGLYNMVIIPCALADCVGSVKLYLASPIAHSIIRKESSYIEVPCKTLDQIVFEYKILTIDLLHIDAEEATFRILEGCRKSLQRNIIRRIIIEIEREDEIDLLNKFLSSLSYKIFRKGVLLFAQK